MSFTVGDKDSFRKKGQNGTSNSGSRPTLSLGESLSQTSRKSLYGRSPFENGPPLSNNKNGALRSLLVRRLSDSTIDTNAKEEQRPTLTRVNSLESVFDEKDNANEGSHTETSLFLLLGKGKQTKSLLGTTSNGRETTNNNTEDYHVNTTTTTTKEETNQTSSPSKSRVYLPKNEQRRKSTTKTRRSSGKSNRQSTSRGNTTKTTTTTTTTTGGDESGQKKESSTKSTRRTSSKEKTTVINKSAGLSRHDSGDSSGAGGDNTKKQKKPSSNEKMNKGSSAGTSTISRQTSGGSEKKVKQEATKPTKSKRNSWSLGDNNSPILAPEWTASEMGANRASIVRRQHFLGLAELETESKHPLSDEEPNESDNDIIGTVDDLSLHDSIVKNVQEKIGDDDNCIGTKRRSSRILDNVNLETDDNASKEDSPIAPRNRNSQRLETENVDDHAGTEGETNFISTTRRSIRKLEGIDTGLEISIGADTGSKFDDSSGMKQSGRRTSKKLEQETAEPLDEIGVSYLSVDIDIESDMDLDSKPAATRRGSGRRRSGRVEMGGSSRRHSGRLEGSGGSRRRQSGRLEGKGGSGHRPQTGLVDEHGGSNHLRHSGHNSNHRQQSGRPEAKGGSNHKPRRHRSSEVIERPQQERPMQRRSFHAKDSSDHQKSGLRRSWHAVDSEVKPQKRRSRRSMVIAKQDSGRDHSDLKQVRKSKSMDVAAAEALVKRGNRPRRSRSDVNGPVQRVPEALLTPKGKRPSTKRGTRDINNSQIHTLLALQDEAQRNLPDSESESGEEPEIIEESTESEEDIIETAQPSVQQQRASMMLPNMSQFVPNFNFGNAEDGHGPNFLNSMSNTVSSFVPNFPTANMHMNVNMNMNMSSFVPTLNATNMRLPTAADMRSSFPAMPNMGAMGSNLAFGRAREAGPSFDVPARPSEEIRQAMESSSSEKYQTPTDRSDSEKQVSDYSFKDEEDAARQEILESQHSQHSATQKIRDRQRRSRRAPPNTRNAYR